MNNPYEWLQIFIDQVPSILQPLIVALAGAVPYIEGEGAAAFGIIAGINPIIAAIAGATGNILCVIAIVLLGSNVRERVVVHRASRTVSAQETGTFTPTPHGAPDENKSSSTAPNTSSVDVIDYPAGDGDSKPARGAKGQVKLRRWLVKFGVPGASLLAPLALPTMLTAAFFVGMGIPKKRVIFWQVIAIFLWTSAVAIAATSVLAGLGW
ncbi:small multidrug efflux protein [Arthrobacter sp. AL08]|uniref:small multidrug efflux protein n=1 Tax=Micrococcaceae TaxID=1268 RepID=UPI00249B7426|nr:MULTISPECIES: small multidrug efflux protein [Micrococcaceae]MDI3241373.1 small multidrug efflux protein [Arthrobacter sp. AL05]MDI3277370.1 small multidrug efflux protein [Arthrobacter sp. AL08]MDJ0354033.1 small multidrug efflux protein [Pseudarthrobacter sp. PH31-O2]